MPPHSMLLRRAARQFSPRALINGLACALLLVAVQTASAQCVPNPTGETAVGLKNASSYYLTFYIDGVRKDAVPSGDRSVDFVVTPGEHTLRAEATINGETSSATHTGEVPKGHVCTWIITDPPDGPGIRAESKRRLAARLSTAGGSWHH